MNDIARLLKLLVACISVVRWSAWAQANVPESELDALWSIYNCTDGDDWLWQEYGAVWNFSSPTANPCVEDWQGVTCTTSITAGYVHVLSLELSQQGLSGFFPSAIGNLSYLRNLSLAHNNLHGNLPTNAWDKLHNLTVLNLEQNRLTGPVPNSLGNLRNLKLLAVGGNSFSGPIPPVFTSLTRLRVLDFANNRLTGYIPNDLGDLQDLVILSLGGNALMGTFPLSILALQRMRFLDLSFNELTGELPVNLGDLIELPILYLSENMFTGTVPTSLSMLQELRAFGIYYNELSGSIVPLLTELRKVLLIDISDNAFTGRIDQSVPFALSLHSLFLGDNRLSGTIPLSLCGLTNLTKLSLGGNSFSGTIPEELSRLHALTQLDLAGNTFHGTIPENLGDLTHLQFFGVSDNKLTGTMPVLALHALQISVHANFLTGTIPSAYLASATLSLLDVSENYFTGTIPNSISAMHAAAGLYLYGNLLHGTIPDSIGSLTLLLQLYLDNNQLTGTIPKSLSSLPYFQFLILNDNFLTGSVPAELGSAFVMEQLVLSSNYLTGTIPAVIGNLTELTALALDINFFTGTIPAELGLLSALQYLSMPYNLLYTTLPAQLGNLGQLIDLVLTSSGLTGTIPLSFGQLRQLQNLQLQQNSLRGTIPAEIGSMTDIAVLNVSFNALVGSIPPLSGLHNLQQLYLLGNQLTGTLDGVFDSSAQGRLSVLSVSNNGITGTLPDMLFQLPALSSLIAAQNCFTGTLPDTVCSSLLLSSLNLDGLHTAAVCKHRIVPGTDIYQGSNAFHGTIPACLVNLPALSSLHLTGNGLTGSIPMIPGTRPQLIELVLAHNALTGTIPESVQLHNWRTLDLSFNRIGGNLLSSFGAYLGETNQTVDGAVITSDANTVYLQNNRLSGRIPSALVHLQNISILGSNMFSCNAARTDLPVHDSARDKYECSSDSFNRHFYVALIMAALLAVVWVCRHWWPSSMKTALVRVEQRLREVEINEDAVRPRLRTLLTMCRILCQVAVVSTVAVLVSLVPWYAIAHSYFSTYTHTYAWVVSAAFLSGLTPAVTSLLLYCTLMVVVVLVAAVLVMKTDGAVRKSSRAVASPPTGTSPELNWTRVGAYVLFLTINMSVVLSVNIGFVAVTLSANTAVVTLAQLLLSLFKLVWNIACTSYMIDLVTAFTYQERISPTMVTIHMFLSLVNNIVIPCLVVAAQSPSCFNEWFSSTPSVSAVYTIPGCFLQYQDSTFNYTTVCSFSSPVELSTDFNPLFSYNYQCSSSFITYYAPAFVYLGLAAGIGVPIAKVVALHLLLRATPGTRWLKVLNVLVPRILKTVPPSDTSAIPVSAHAGSFDTAISGFKRIRKDRLMDPNSVVNTLVTYLGILLTFGVVFPPLAAVMCATMLSVVWQSRVVIGRALHNAQANHSLRVADTLERDCMVVLSVTSLRRVLFIIVCICCCFYALFLFDTLGDAEGLHSSYWVLIVMPAFPVVLYGVNRVHRRCTESTGPGSATFFLDQVELAVIDGNVNPTREGVRDGGEHAIVGYANSVSEVIVSDVAVNALHEP